MRNLPTESELLIRDAIKHTSEKEGYKINFPERDQHDKPDLLFEIGEVRVACECTQIPPSYIYQYRFKTESWDGFDFLSTTYPNEPHQWAKDAVEKKAKLIESYIKRTNAHEAWLVIHLPHQENQFFLNHEEEWVKWALRHGTKLVKHNFSQIYLWSPKGGIQVISVQRNEKGTNSELILDFGYGYPTICNNRASIRFRTTNSSQQKPNKTFQTCTTKKSRIIEPIDNEYKNHNPSNRVATYRFEGLAWNDRIKITGSVNFDDLGDEIFLEPIYVDNLEPNKDYWAHYLHEFRSPAQLKTKHRFYPQNED